MRRVTPVLAAWLVAVWLLLWGSVDVSIVVFGVLLAVAVLALFPLPKVRTRFFARPLRLVALICYLVWDLVLSGLRVAVDAVRYGPRVRATVVEVPVLTDSDHLVASAANMLSLSPGKIILQIDRPGGLFYVYALGVRSAAASDRAYQEVIAMQVRVTRAFGTSAEVTAVLDRARTDPGPRRSITDRAEEGP